MSKFFNFIDTLNNRVDIINLFFQDRQQRRIQIIDLPTHLQALEQADVFKGFEVHGGSLPFGDTPLLQEADFAIRQLKNQLDQILGIDLGGLCARQFLSRIHRIADAKDLDPRLLGRGGNGAQHIQNPLLPGIVLGHLP